MKHFPNVMGNPERENITVRELTSAGIPVLKKENRPFRVYGREGDVYFYRCPLGWVIKYDLPIKLANDIYHNPQYRGQISVAGFSRDPVTNNQFLKQKGRTSVPFLFVDTWEAFLFVITALRQKDLI